MDINYYIFDWDDNILNMDTEIFVEYFENEKWIERTISSSHYRIARKSSLYRPVENGYRNCHGDGPQFLSDVTKAIENKDFGPSFNSLITSLVNGDIISIVTARGHGSKTIKSGVEYVIFNYLSDEQRLQMLSNLNKNNINSIEDYLNTCMFTGVYSPEFIETLPEGIEENVENYKRIAIERCIEHYLNHSSTIKYDSMSVGFSDDDKHNVDKITEYFRELKLLLPHINFSIFDTSEKKHEKLCIE